MLNYAVRMGRRPVFIDLDVGQVRGLLFAMKSHFNNYLIFFFFEKTVENYMTCHVKLV